MNDLVAAAHQYLSAGLQVMALSGKAPNALVHPHGLKQALRGIPESESDDRLLELAFGHRDTTGVGIVIQFPYLVVDIDGEAGARAWADLLGTVDLDRTPVARTARGLHVWFADTTERRSTRLGEKLDLKAVGGYVVAPPSKHPDGPIYEWLSPLVDAESGQIISPMELPDELAVWLDGTERAVADFPVGPRRGEPMLEVSASNVWRIVDGPATISGLARHVASLREGNRNAGLFWAAATARDDGFPLTEALAALGTAAQEAGLAAREARTAILSAYRSPR